MIKDTRCWNLFCYRSAEPHHAECRYAKWRSAECHGAHLLVASRSFSCYDFSSHFIMKHLKPVFRRKNGDSRLRKWTVGSTSFNQKPFCRQIFGRRIMPIGWISTQWKNHNCVSPMSLCQRSVSQMSVWYIFVNLNFVSLTFVSQMYF